MASKQRDGGDGSRPLPAADGAKVFCVSDLHTDHEENLEWCRSLFAQREAYQRDVLIVAGDVTSGLVILEETLKLLAGTFGRVFYVPGNHDLWVKGGRANSGGMHIRPKPITSLEKLDEIRALCARCGVAVEVEYAAGAIIAPLLSWHHASWDTEPDIRGWDGIPPVERVLADYMRCEWPPPLSVHDDSIARRLDTLNDDGGTPMQARVEALRAAHPGAPLITFSHFVPRVDLSPEKRFLFVPTLAKGLGSTRLAERITSLAPALHVFGHSHIGWVRGRAPPPPADLLARIPSCHAHRRRAEDCDRTRCRCAVQDATHDGVRYIQAPLSYPSERRDRLGTVATGERFPHGTPATPVLVYDGAAGTFPPRYDAGWSNFYARYPRLPGLSHVLAPYVASAFTPQPGVGKAGWFGDAVDPQTGEPWGQPFSAWQLGPKSAATFERTQRETNSSDYVGGERHGELSPFGLRRRSSESSSPTPRSAR